MKSVSLKYPYFQCLFTITYCINYELELQSVLFNESRYSNLVLPRQNTNDVVDISLQWTFMRLGDLSEKESKLSLTSVVNLKWKDEYLIWDPALYGGLTSFTATGNEIWTPDFRIYNKLDSSFLQNGLEVEKLKVTYNGTIEAVIFGDLSTICDVNPEKFPVDCHECSLVLGIPPRSTRQYIVWNKLAPYKNFDEIKDKHPIWKIEKVETVPLGPNSILRMYIRRLPTHYIYTLVFPASSLSILSILMFFIPIDEGERISFGVTIFLSFMVLMLQASDLLPANSKNISAIGKYFLLLICSGLVAIVNSVVISYFQRKTALSNHKNNSISPEDSDNKEIVEKIDGDFLDKDKKMSDKRPLSTNTDEFRHLSKRPFLAWKLDSIFVQKTRKWISPLRIFDWASFLACFVLCVYAHIELAIVTQENTCSNI